MKRLLLAAAAALALLVGVALLPAACVGDLPAEQLATDGGARDSTVPLDAADAGDRATPPDASDTGAPPPEGGDSGPAVDTGCLSDAGGTAVWAKIFGDGNDQFLYGLAVDGTGNVALSGSFGGMVDFGGPSPLVSAGGLDAFVVSLRPTAMYYWGARFGAATTDETGTAITATPTGAVFSSLNYKGVVSNLDGDASVPAPADSNFNDALLLRFDVGGVLNAHGTLAGQGEQSITGLAPSSAVTLTAENAGTLEWLNSGNMLVPYSTQGSYDAFIGQTLGSNAWAFDYGGGVGDLANQRAEGVSVDPASGMAVVGYFAGSLVLSMSITLTTAGNSDAFVAKLDANGNVLWATRYGDSAEQRATLVVIDPTNHHIYVSGQFQGTINFGSAQPLVSNGGYDVFVVELDENGNFVWSKSFGGLADEVPNALAQDPCGNLLLAGDVASTIDFGGGTLTSQGMNDAFLAKLKADGSYVFARSYGDAADQHGRGVGASAGMIFFGGYTTGTIDLGLGPLNPTGGADVFVARLSP